MLATSQLCRISGSKEMAQHPTRNRLRLFLVQRLDERFRYRLKPRPKSVDGTPSWWLSVSLSRPPYSLSSAVNMDKSTWHHDGWRRVTETRDHWEAYFTAIPDDVVLVFSVLRLIFYVSRRIEEYRSVLLTDWVLYGHRVDAPAIRNRVSWWLLGNMGENKLKLKGRWLEGRWLEGVDNKITLLWSE